MTAAASAPFKLSGSHVDSLWLGVLTIMDLRTERSALWNVPEVHATCKRQRQDLLSYRSAVVSVMAQFTDPSSPAITAKSINTAYIQLFLPFWWEHILSKARLDETGAAYIQTSFIEISIEAGILRSGKGAIIRRYSRLSGFTRSLGVGIITTHAVDALAYHLTC